MHALAILLGRECCMLADLRLERMAPLHVRRVQFFPKERNENRVPDSSSSNRFVDMRGFAIMILNIAFTK